MDKTNKLDEDFLIPSLLKSKLRSVFLETHPTQILNILEQKYKFGSIKYIFSNDPENPEITKCVGSINNEIFAEGYNKLKKDAKKIASEQLIIELLKIKKFAKSVKEFLIKEYHAKEEIFHCHGFTIFDEADPCDNTDTIGKDDPSDSHDWSPENINNNSNANTASKNDQILLGKKRKLTEDNIISLSILAENKTNGYNAKPIKPWINDTELTSLSKSGYNSSLLHFDLFVIKWERILIIEPILFSKIHDTIKEISLLLLKAKINIPFKQFSLLGSFETNTLRNNYWEVDYFVEYEDNIDSNTIISKFIDINESYFRNNNFTLDCNTTNNWNTLKFTRDNWSINCYLLTTSETTEIKQHFKNIKEEPLNWEQVISVKFLKAWRRAQNWWMINPMIFEFIVMSRKYHTIYEYVNYVFKVLEGKEKMKGNEANNDKYDDYKNKVLNKWWSGNDIIKIKERVKFTVDVINKSQFDQIF